MTDSLITFSYSIMQPEMASRLQQTAAAIRSSARRQVDEVISTGRALIDAKSSLPHGQFGAWLAAEFKWSPRSAQRYISVAEAFGSNTTCVTHLPVAVVYRLAALPSQVRDRVLEAGSKGEDETVIRIAQVAHDAKQDAINAAKSPEKRKAKAEREKRRISAVRRRQEAWENEQEVRRREQKKAAQAALQLVQQRIPEKYKDFLRLVHAADHSLWSAVRSELLGESVGAGGMA